MLLIHSPITPRTEYIFELFFGSLIPVPHRLTGDRAEFGQHTGPKLSYGDAPIDDDVPFVRAAGLLSQKGVSPQHLAPFTWKDTLGVFPVADSRAAFPFDPFAATFFLVSRYEEYGSSERDQHGRYRPDASVLLQQGFLRQPVVNQYALHLRQMLAGRFPDLRWPRLPFSGCSTVDVDIAYAYRGRPIWYTAGAAIRQALTRSRGGVAERFRVLAGRQRDPYDTYDWLEDVHRRFDVPLIYFMLVGRRGRLDRNLPPGGRTMAELVGRLASRREVGLHPSYRSNRHPPLIGAEAAALERMTGRRVVKSRQHFLMLDLPETYRRLVQHGIREDYTMGYASEPGFRAGIAQPFRFYDLGREEVTPLTVFPLAYMDGTLMKYGGMAPDEAVRAIRQLAAGVYRTGGFFMSLWHNDTVADLPPWKGWQRVFLESLRTMREPPQSVTAGG